MVCPPTVTDPLRDAPVFAAADTVTLSEPVPLAGEGVSQPWEDTAVHAQPDMVVTVIVTAPPPTATDALVGSMLNWQAAPA